MNNKIIIWIVLVSCILTLNLTILTFIDVNRIFNNTTYEEKSVVSLLGDGIPNTEEIVSHLELFTKDINQYINICYKDSISINEFEGKSTNGHWFQTKGRYYYDPFVNYKDIKYVHRIPTNEGFLEFMVLKYSKYIKSDKQ